MQKSTKSASASARAESSSSAPSTITQLKRDLAGHPLVTQLAQLKPAMSGGVIQRKDDESPKASTAAAPTGGGQALPGEVRSKMEDSFGADFSDVRVHQGGHVGELGALAYTQGNEVHFAPGQYQPHDQGGQQLLGHELAHVVQQRAGRVASGEPVQGKGLEVNADAGLEAEADTAGAAAAKGQPAHVAGAASGGVQAATSSSAVVQCYKPLAHGNYTLNQDPLDQHNPFTSQDNDPVLLGDPMAPETNTIRFVRQAEATPDLLVSEDDTLAIQDTTKEPKEFYAHPTVLTNANNALAAKGSMIRLEPMGHTLDLGGGHSVTMVQPRRENDVVPAAAGEFADFVYHRCINFAMRNMGKAMATNYDVEAVLENSVTHEQSVVPMTTTSDDSRQINRLAEYVGANAAPDHGGASGAMSAATNPTSGEGYGTSLRGGGRDGAASTLGINQHARAEVGEGYGTYSVSSGHGKTDFSTVDHADVPVVRGFMWGYHYAAVVAASLDQQDSITLENYNRTDDTTALLGQLAQRFFNGFAGEVQAACPMPGADESRNDKCIKYKQIYLKAEELRGVAEDQANVNYQNAINEESGKAWYFGIQGPQAGQSFHEKAVASGFYANPLTVRVRRPDKELAAVEYTQRLNAIPALNPAVTAHPAAAAYNGLVGAARSAISQGANREAIAQAFRAHRATLVSAQLDIYFAVAAEAAMGAGLFRRAPTRPISANGTVTMIAQWLNDLHVQASQTTQKRTHRRINGATPTLLTCQHAANAVVQWVISQPA